MALDSLRWQADGQRKRGCPRNTWGRSVDREVVTVGYAWTVAGGCCAGPAKMEVSPESPMFLIRDARTLGKALATPNQIRVVTLSVLNPLYYNCLEQFLRYFSAHSRLSKTLPHRIKSSKNQCAVAKTMFLLFHC